MELARNKYPKDFASLYTRLAPKIYELEIAVNSFGVQLEYRTDFRNFRETARSIPGKGNVTAVFDDRHCDIGPNNGFWVKAYDRTGRVIHIQAMRHDDLTGTTLARHWLKAPRMFAPAGYNVVLEKCDFETAPASHSITGSVCYHGDFWLDRSFRKMALPPILSKFAMLKALSQFSPDFIYGLMPPPLAERGWAARQGYLHMHPWAPRWHVQGEKEYYDDYLVWISGPELLKLWTAGKRNIDILGRTYVTNNGRAATAKSIAGQ